jgi:hypothetical protein
MKRKDLKAFCQAKADEFGRMGYAHWRKQAFPIAAEVSSGGETLQLELVLLEDTDEYLHVSVSADDGGWLNARVPPTSSFIVRKKA